MVLETKRISIKFTKAKTKNCLSLRHNGENISFFVFLKNAYKVKSKHNNNYPSQFCLESILNKFEALELEDVSFKGTVYDFLVDYNIIVKSGTLNIHAFNIHI